MVAIKRILCPTDYSNSARVAIDYARELAATFGASIVLLHVVPPSAYPMRNFGTITGFPNLRDEIRKRVDEEMKTLAAGIEGVGVEPVVTEGVPHNQILDQAAEHDCDLIVMSTHGHTGIKHALLGSTAERVVRMSSRPVLTIRAPND